MSPRPARARLDVLKIGALLDRLDAGPDRRCAVPECLHRPAGMGASRAMQALSAWGARPGSER